MSPQKPTTLSLTDEHMEALKSILFGAHVVAAYYHQLLACDVPEPTAKELTRVWMMSFFASNKPPAPAPAEPGAPPAPPAGQYL